MASVWAELRRRNVFKLAAAYAIVGWLVVEVAATVLPFFEAPDWILQVFTVFVILGFPLALILSWALPLASLRKSSITRTLRRRLFARRIGVGPPRSEHFSAPLS